MTKVITNHSNFLCQIEFEDGTSGFLRRGERMETEKNIVSYPEKWCSIVNKRAKKKQSQSE